MARNTWHCTNEFYASYIADPRTRLCEIAKTGIKLEWRWCETHQHQKSKEWRLSAQPVPLPEAALVPTYAGAKVVSSLPDQKPQALFTYKAVFVHE